MRAGSPDAKPSDQPAAGVEDGPQHYITPSGQHISDYITARKKERETREAADRAHAVDASEESGGKSEKRATKKVASENSKNSERDGKVDNSDRGSVATFVSAAVSSKVNHERRSSSDSDS
ncbi:MAG: hypothetical protein SGPRY_003862, partial [Prymnesium sp.]